MIRGTIFRANKVLAAAFLAGTTFAIPVLAQAMSVRQYESETIKQKVTDEGNAIRKIIADVAKVNPCLAGVIHAYFWVIPPGRPESPGLIGFEGGLQAVENLAAQGKFDLDKVQIEGILLDLIKTDVMPPFAKRPPPSMGSVCIYEGTVDDSAKQSNIFLEAYSTAHSNIETQLRSSSLADGQVKTPQRVQDDRNLADAVVGVVLHLTDKQSQALHDIIEQSAATQPNTELVDVISSFLLNEAKKQLGQTP